jgi:hypothetical protein
MPGLFDPSDFADRFVAFPFSDDDEGHTETADAQAAHTFEDMLEQGEDTQQELAMATLLPEVLEALEDLVERCDGSAGVRADGSNIDTRRAHAVLAKSRRV